MSTTIPKIRVTIPPALRSLCSKQGESRHGEVCLIGRDVRELLAELARKHPDVYVRVCDEHGEPRKHINVFVNDDHIRMLVGLDSPLTAGDVVTILPAVSGG